MASWENPGVTYLLPDCDQTTTIRTFASRAAPKI
jgi:hypothetical protein